MSLMQQTNKQTKSKARIQIRESHATNKQTKSKQRIQNTDMSDTQVPVTAETLLEADVKI